MARSPYYSPSPSPGFDSPPVVISDSSDDEEVAPFADPNDPGPSASRPGSPSQAEGPVVEEVIEGDTMTCQWEDCNRVFNHLPSLIEHIHNDHIGVHKSNYTCEWSTCPRRGIAQTSRFALISHIRSHTGEKPFICSRPECDKSFTRSDALAKHMRIQHNIIPPLPGRGGNRKRKREREEPEVAQPVASDGYTTFRVDPHHSDIVADYEESQMQALEANGHAPRNGFIGRRRSSSPDSGEDSDPEEGIPQHLVAAMDRQTGLIFGRTPSMVKYLLMKAKFQYAMTEHESLLEELRCVRSEERAWRERKDALLDEVLRVTFGSHAEDLITPQSFSHAPQNPRYLVPEERRSLVEEPDMVV